MFWEFVSFRYFRPSVLLIYHYHVIYNILIKI